MANRDIQQLEAARNDLIRQPETHGLPDSPFRQLAHQIDPDVSVAKKQVILIHPMDCIAEGDTGITFQLLRNRLY